MVAKTTLTARYRAYIECLNARDWNSLGGFVTESVQHNGHPLGPSGYRAMLERDVALIPDLYFDVDLLIADPPMLASRLCFNCAPTGVFMGLPVNGKRVLFTENVFYAFQGDRIARVWSVIDTAAIAAQL